MKVVAVLYPGGSAADDPEVLGCAENALGLKELLEEQGHELVSTTEREDEGLLQHLRDANVLITTPFWPVYVTKEMLGGASNLGLILTAGVGSDHVDLGEAAERGITVAEITGSNTVSVAEHAAMQILVLVRNFIPAYNDIVEGGWSIGEIASGSHDLEGKTVGIYGAGQIGQLIAARLKPFDVNMLYFKRSRLGTVEELSLGIRYTTLEEMTAECGVIVIASPLTPETEGLFDRETLFAMKQGAYLVNIARGAIVETDALVEALEEGHLGGYAGDVWYPEPAPPDHPWRNMPRHAMTPHVSGTTLEAQKRYAAGVRDSLTSFLEGTPIRDDYVMVADGQIQSGSYKAIYG
jgi:formate dehydrogenase